MASNINPLVPAEDGLPAAKSDLRDNLQAAKTEIEELQSGGPDKRIAVSNTVSPITLSETVHRGSFLEIQNSAGPVEIVLPPHASVSRHGVFATGVVQAGSWPVTISVSEPNTLRGTTLGRVGSFGADQLYLGSKSGAQDEAVFAIIRRGGLWTIWCSTGLRLNEGEDTTPGVSTGASTSGSLGAIIVTDSAFGAVGNGIDDDTAAIQLAIDTAPSGSVIFFPFGRFLVDKISVPHDKSLIFRGVSPIASRVVGRTPGQDVFHCDNNGQAAQNRFRTVHGYENFGIEINSGTGESWAQNYNRCTGRGYPIGPACIAYDSDFLSPSLATSVNQAWPNTFGYIKNVFLELVDVDSAKNDAHDCVGIYFGGTSYGWRIEDIRAHGVHWAFVQSAPFIRRCIPSSDTDTLNYSVGNDVAYPENAEVYALAHTGAGTTTPPLERSVDYWVLDPSPGSLQLSASPGPGAAIDLTSTGSAPVYVAARDAYSAVIAPDGVTIANITHYSGKGAISVITPEGMLIGRVDAYGASVSGLEIVDWDSGSRDFGISCKVVGPYYTESPQSSALVAVDQEQDPFIYINMRGGSIQDLQFRGETAGVTRPRLALYGIGYDVTGLRMLSSLSQAQPDVYLYGSGIGVYGQAHSLAGLVDQGDDNHYILKSDAEGLVAQSFSPYRQRLPVTAPASGTRTPFVDSTNPLIGPVSFAHVHTVAAAGDALGLTVFIKGSANANPQTPLDMIVRYGGQEMTEIGSSAPYIQGGAPTIRSYLLGGVDLTAPLAGSNLIEIEPTAGQDIQCIAAIATDLANVSRAGKFGRNQSVGAVTTDGAAVDTLGNDSLILASIAVQGDASGPFTPNANFTELEDSNTGGGSASTDISFMLAERVWPVASQVVFDATWPTAAGRSVLAVEIRGLDLV